MSGVRMMILSHPDHRLLTPVKKDPIDSQLAEMYTPMMKHWLDTRKDGVALAANQIGLNVAMFVYYDKNNYLRTVLNPEITTYSEEIESEDEGCLSLIKTYVSKKPRSKSIEVIYTDFPSMKKLKVWKHDFEARIFQHEIDHLNGRLIISK